MNVNTSFCCELLRAARRDAKAYGVTVPRSLTALQVTRNQGFVQGRDDAGEYVSGDNAYEARANYITLLIHRAHPQLEGQMSTRITLQLPADAAARLGAVLKTPEGRAEFAKATGTQVISARVVPQTWDVYWSPEGRCIATVEAKDARSAIRKAPQPFRGYLGEMYALIVTDKDAPCDVTPTCLRHGHHAH